MRLFVRALERVVYKNISMPRRMERNIRALIEWLAKDSEVI